MPRELSASTLKESKESFVIYSKEGLMNIKHIKDALLSLGINPTDKQIEYLEKEFEDSPGINYKTFKVSYIYFCYFYCVFTTKFWFKRINTKRRTSHQFYLVILY